jgi:hypothetical protein
MLAYSQSDARASICVRAVRLHGELQKVDPRVHEVAMAALELFPNDMRVQEYALRFLGCLVHDRLRGSASATAAPGTLSPSSLMGAWARLSPHRPANTAPSAADDVFLSVLRKPVDAPAKVAEAVRRNAADAYVVQYGLDTLHKLEQLCHNGASVSGDKCTRTMSY